MVDGCFGGRATASTTRCVRPVPPGANPDHGKAPVHVVNIDREYDKLFAEQIDPPCPRADIVIVVARRLAAAGGAVLATIAQPIEEC